MASLLQIDAALRDLEVCEGEKPTLEPAIEALHKESSRISIVRI